MKQIFQGLTPRRSPVDVCLLQGERGSPGADGYRGDKGEQGLKGEKVSPDAAGGNFKGRLKHLFPTTRGSH